MRSIVFAFALVLGLALSACAADAPNPPAASTAAAMTKVTLDLHESSIKDTAEEIAAQTGVSIIVDPKATGKVTINLNDTELTKALDAITKVGNLTWRKFQFARQEDAKVDLDQLKTAALTLASVQIVGLSVSDPASKTTTVFAKNLDPAPDTATVPLPKGYSWATVYVVMPPEVDSAAEASASSNQVATLSKEQAQMALEMAKMAPEQRQQIFASMWAAQMDLAPEDRQAMLRDQVTAISNMDPSSRAQIGQDWRTVMSSMRGPGRQPGP